MKSNKISPYYLFEEACSRNPSGEAIWSRYGNYTWQEVYTNTNKYAHWFLSQGIKPGDIVGFYLHNSAEFMFAWMGLIAINAAPAMINYNIQGHALIHSLKISRIGILLVDEDPDFQGRIEGEKSRIEDELGIKCVVVNEKMRKELSVESGERPGDEYRSGVSPHSLVSLLYTSGTTGFSKAVAFTVHRCYIMGSSVRSLSLPSHYLIASLKYTAWTFERLHSHVRLYAALSWNGWVCVNSPVMPRVDFMPRETI